MAYVPSNPPRDTALLAEWLQRETQAIAQAAQFPVPYVILDTLYAPPKKLIDGMVAKADGTSWNPGSGAGVYVYKVSAWVLLG